MNIIFFEVLKEEKSYEIRNYYSILFDSYGYNIFINIPI